MNYKKLQNKFQAKFHITQHKDLISDGTYLNFCFAKISYMLGTLHELFLKKAKNE